MLGDIVQPLTQAVPNPPLLHLSAGKLDSEVPAQARRVSEPFTISLTGKWGRVGCSFPPPRLVQVSGLTAGLALKPRNHRQQLGADNIIAHLGTATVPLEHKGLSQRRAVFHSSVALKFCSLDARG